jgi:Flp pilus assembly protein TadD
VFKRIALSVSLSLLVAAVALGPLAAQAGAPSEREVALMREAAARSVAQESEGAAGRKGNGFGRAISAPFRALARLFGGGRKKSAAKQSRRPESQAGTAAAPTRTTTPAAPAPAAVERADATQTPGPPSQQVTAAARIPTTDRGAVIVRPADAAPGAAPAPKVFVPVIEGVGRDPLSQGRALLEHGYLNEAVSELSIAATTVAPGSNLVEANNLLGLAYDRLGRHRQAAESYQRALTVAPGDPVILANLGYSLYLSNDYEGALKRLKQAAKIAPGLSVVHNNVGIVQARLGKFDDAYKSFARASGEYDARLKVASILESVGRDRQAVKHYEAALRLQPDTSAVIERLLALYERTGQSDKAETARRALGRPANPQRTTTGGG